MTSYLRWVFGKAGIFFLAVSLGLGQGSVWAWEGTGQSPTLPKLRVGFSFHQSGQLEEARRLYLEVLQESRDSEEMAVVQELLLSLNRIPPPGPSPPAPGLSSETTRSSPAPSGNLAVEIPEEGESLPVTQWMERSLPVFVQVFSERLSRSLEAVGERELTRQYTEAEFRQVVLRGVQARLPQRISDVATQIRPDGIVGSGTVHLGRFRFQLASRVGISVVNERPHARIHELKVGSFVAPELLRRMIERQINLAIDRQRSTLRVKEFSLAQGSARISVELI
ncbi:MAG: hypothetical protein HYZ90_03040 [Candidatus Omnitrophica bacterium]|nr:hypothetical protein [Candidatus Omnitrophota bacterium]